jgi:hypothetical protein
MGRKAPAKAFTRQAELIIATFQLVFDHVLARSIIKRISNDVAPRVLQFLRMENHGADVMRAALSFDSLCCPCCQEQGSDTD